MTVSRWCSALISLSGTAISINYYRLMINMRNEKFDYDKFADFEFSARAWSAKRMTDPEEIRHAISLLHLEDRTIEQIKFIGLCYNLRRDNLEDCVYNYYDQIGEMEEEEKQRKSDYDNIDPQYSFYRWAEIDEPLLIRFADGDCFEIKAPFAAAYRFSMNKIPWNISAGINQPNAEANTVLGPAIGKTIVAVEIDKASKDSAPSYFEDFLAGDLEEYVAGIILRLEDGSGIRVYGDLDFTWVEYIGSDNETAGIPFKELKEGLFNFEDLHYDESVDFYSISPAFFFGKCGAKHVDTPCTMLVPGDGKTEMNIYNCDFDLFDWAITAATGSYYEFDDYDFSSKEWAAILDQAEKLLSFESFDDLFEYVRLLKKPDGTPNWGLFHSINCSGADFWSKRRRYKDQLISMRKWTDLTMSEDDHMRIIGY